MSSTILSRPIDVSKFGLIYAGAQKNIGAAGLVVMIVREDLLDRCPKGLPKIFSYAEQAAQDSMLNTPNTFGWYLASLVFKWLKKQGGVAVMAEQNRAKLICGACSVRAECLAEALDNRIEWGVWGGMTERERRALLRRRPNVATWRSVLQSVS